MSKPTPAPRLDRDGKKPIPAPRHNIMLRRQNSNESSSSSSISKSSEENTKTFSRRMRSLSNASKQIAEDIGDIVQDRIIEGTRQSVRRITKRFQTSPIELGHDTKSTDEDISKSIDIFNSIKFDSPLSTSDLQTYYNLQHFESLPPPAVPPPPLPDDPLYDAPSSICSSYKSLDVDTDNDSPSLYESLYPTNQKESSNTTISSSLCDETTDENISLSRSNSWNFYDAVGGSENTYSNTGDELLKSVDNDKVDLNSNFNVEIRNSLYNVQPPPARPSKSVIFQFDPLLNGDTSTNDNTEHSDEYQLLEKLLIRDLRGSVLSPNTIDNWSLSESDSEEFIDPPSPPVRFDSLPDEPVPNATGIDERSKSTWFTTDSPRSSGIEKRSWYKHVKEVVLTSSDILKGKFKENNVPRPMLSAGNFSYKKGMLYKVQNGPVEDLLKEYSGRWCILENSRFVCYSDNTCESVKEHFPMDSIISIHIIQDPKVKYKQDNCDLHCFKLSVSGRIRSQHIYGSRNMSERRVWMQTLAACLTDIFPTKILSDYTRMGWAYVREGVSSKWSGAWVILSNRVLNYAIDGQPLKTIDLRKVRCIALQRYQEADCVPHTHDRGPNMLVDTLNSFLYLRMWTTRETKVWCHHVKTAAHNNGPLLDEMQLTKNDVPVIVHKCINFIYLQGSMSKGIYRQSGVGSAVSELLTKFTEDAWSFQITFDKFNEHDVATALKRFFRDLPEPVLGTTHRQYLYQVALVKNTEDRIRMYKAALETLSPVAYNTARKVIGHLHFISTQSAQNLMTVDNLAAIWGPTLMHFQRDSTGSGSHLKDVLVVGQLIALYKYIFPEDAQETQQEKVMLQVLEKYVNSPQGAVNKAAGDFRIWIYFNNKEGPTFNIALGPKKTAYEVCLELKSKINLDTFEMILEEVVLTDRLRRPIHHSEKVLDVILKWGSWDEADRKDNYILISKMSKYAEYMNHSGISVNGEVKYADTKSKSFKLSMFQFHQGQLNHFKDKASEMKLASWKIENICVYCGNESKRNPQSKWTVTFLQTDVAPTRTKSSPFFGHIIAWPDSQSRAKWFGAMLKALYPDGLHPPLVHLNK